LAKVLFSIYGLPITIQMLLKMLPAYYNHVRAFEDTLVTKFFGLHCVKSGVQQKKVRKLYIVHPILIIYPCFFSFSFGNGWQELLFTKEKIEL